MINPLPSPPPRPGPSAAPTPRPLAPSGPLRPALVLLAALATLVLSPATTHAHVRQSSTLYIGRHYEIRDHDQPVKYIFNGQTRVARVTGSLSPNLRVQKLRLRAGWNLCSVALTLTNPAAQIPVLPGGLLLAAYVLHPDTHSWVELSAHTSLPPGSVLWLRARADATLPLKGTYLEPPATLVPQGDAFVASPGLHPLSLTNAAPAFQYAAGSWWTRLPPLPDLPPGWPSILAPGAAAFLHAGQGLELSLPPPDSRVAYYHQDHLGSTAVLSDASGALLRESAYFPFGSQRHAAPSAPLEPPYAFTQKEQDRETRFLYLEARYLHPALARFTRVDAKNAALDRMAPQRLAEFLAQPQELNLYAYVNNNPLQYVDPTGLEKEKALIIIGAGQEQIKEGTRFSGDKFLGQAAKDLFSPFTQGMDVEVHHVSSAKQMLSLIQSKKWASVSYLGHGVLDSKSLDPGHDSAKTLKEADLLKALIAAGPKNVQLLGCASASTGLARSVSKALPGATVRGMYDLLDVDWVQEGVGKRVTRNELIPKTHYVEYQGGYQMENGKRAARRYWEPGDPRLNDRDMALEAGPPTVPQ